MIDDAHRPLDSDQRVSAAHERAQALAEVMRDQVERAEAAAEAEVRSTRRRRTRRGALAAVWAAMTYVWLLNPGWTRVEPPRPPALAEEVQAVRLNLFLQAQQVEAFREDRGRLPWVLQETGPPLPGMRYRRVDNQSYSIEARSHRVVVDYESGRPAVQLLGSAAELLGRSERVRASARAPEAGGPAGARSGGAP